ncbi:hypothetical protein AC579_4303 [Pseudocercospora musae]|uniref:BTB domain-containing protein n=1 Tax=Pseudocercospora musae TaxID=113226 RepID=A0A139HZ61_9PEZI|nr:hypothetical protein AC579_4303 [Pseudocercospora musae]
MLDDDPQVIEAMLYYLYNFDYGDFSNSPEHVSAIVMDVKMFIIADKYNIKTLMDLAAEKFEVRCREQWREAGFADAIKEVYTAVPGHDDRLKRTIIDIVQENAVQLFDGNNEVSPNFARTARELAEFSADMSKILAIEGTGSMQTYKCPSGGEVFYMSTPTPKNFGCPSGCYGSQTQSWWKPHMQR